MSAGTIDHDGLENRIDHLTYGYWVRSDDKSLQIKDDLYEVPSYEEVENYLEEVKQALSGKNSDHWDCDQFSLCVWEQATEYTTGLGISSKWPLGMVSGYFSWVNGGQEAHTCNWVYLANDKILWIEPQTCELHNLDECVEESIRSMIV